MASDYTEDSSSRAGVVNVDSDSVLYEESEDLRLRTKSWVATDTRQGHSALVPGTGLGVYTRTPTDQDSKVKPFNTNQTSHTAGSWSTENTKIISTAEPNEVEDGHVQEVTQSRYSTRVYPSQPESIYTEGDVESTPLLKNKTKFTKLISPKCCIISILMLLFGNAVFIISGSILTHISTVPGSIYNTIEIQNQDMVLIDFFDAYYYNEIIIKKSLSNRCPDCSVEVYSFNPDNLIVNDNYFNMSSDNVTSTQDDVILPPKYFISGSKVKLSTIFYPTMGHNTSVKFLLFNNLPDFEAFQRGEKPNAYQIYQMQVNEEKKAFSAVITIENTGYYFIGLRPTKPISLKFTVTVHQIYYSRANFPPPVCLLTSTESCTVHFTPSSTDAYTDTLKTCVLVYSIPPHAVAESYYVILDYDVYRSLWNVNSLLLLSTMCLSVLCLVFVCSCWFFSCVWNAIRLKQTPYYYVNIN